MWTKKARRLRVSAQGMRILGLVCLLAAPSVAHAAPDCFTNPECSALADQGKAAHNEKRYAEALRLYQSAYERVADPRLLILRGRSFFKQGQSERALDLYRAALPSLRDEAERSKAEEFIREAELAAQVQAGASPAPTLSAPPTLPEQAVQAPQAMQSPQSQKEPLISVEATPARRPRWRLVTGGVALGAGLLLTGFGASALAAEGQCADIPSAPAQPCDRIYATTRVGGALLGTGAVAVVGGIVLMAWPGK